MLEGLNVFEDHDDSKGILRFDDRIVLFVCAITSTIAIVVGTSVW